MKKAMVTALLVALSLNIVGCSKSNELSVVGGSILCKGKETAITEHRGYEATRDLGENGSIEYYLCDSIEECVHNTAGVLPEDMETFKKAKYYTLYLQTYIYMYFPVKDGFIECNAILADTATLSTTQVVDMMYQDATSLVLKDGIQTVDYNNILDLTVADWDFKARSNEVLIPDIIRIKEDDGSIIADSHVVVNGISIGKYSSAKYDYYQYNGVLIQASIGVDLASYITFKE